MAHGKKEKFAQRVSQLRQAKGVSARDMSLSLGQSAGYINNIENGVNLPSMSMFFYICDYLGVTPEEFFAAELTDPGASADADRLPAAAQQSPAGAAGPAGPGNEITPSPPADREEDGVAFCRFPLSTPPAGDSVPGAPRTGRRPAGQGSHVPYMVYTNGSEGFFITGAGVAAATRVPLRTEWVKNTLPPTTEPSPMSVSPPRIDAPE